jgi:hypothetical protein
MGPRTSRLHSDCDVTFTLGQIPIASRANDLRYISLVLSTGMNVEDANVYRLSHMLSRDIERHREVAEEMEY